MDRLPYWVGLVQAVTVEVAVGVLVEVAVSVAVSVVVKVEVEVGLLVALGEAVDVAVSVAVLLGVKVEVTVEVAVGVKVLTGVEVRVAVKVDVFVEVAAGVLVEVGGRAVAVLVGLEELLGVEGLLLELQAMGINSKDKSESTTAERTKRRIENLRIFYEVGRIIKVKRPKINPL